LWLWQKNCIGDKIGKFVNAILREFLRSDKIEYPAEISQRLASQFSFPKQIIDSWLEYWTAEEVEKSFVAILMKFPNFI